MKQSYFPQALLRAATMVFICLLGAAAWAQPRPWIPPGAQLHAKSTGRTTGHIADLMVVNETDKLINITMPPSAIPRDRGNQGFAIPEPPNVLIPPGSTVHVPLQGFCTDPNLPPPPPGAALPPADVWDTGSPLLPKLQDIIQATTDLQQGGQIVTPLSGNPPREREAVIQQTLWWYIMGPGAYNPCERIRQGISDQYRDTDWYSADASSIEQGIAQMADALARVGQAAGLPEFTPPPIPASVAQPAPAAPPSHPDIANTIRVVGTGRTTGHIADFSAHNPTRELITLRIGQGGSLFIPSNGREQSYIVPSLPDILINPGQTVTVPIEGYCVDVHRPPLGEAQPAPPLSTWTGTAPAPGATPAPPAPGSNLVTLPVQTAPPLPQVADLLDRLPRPPAISRWDCPEALVPTTPLIPGTDTPIRQPINADEAPGLAMPILAEALQRIAQTYDELQPRGGINTPFSNNREREREAVLQQTFWIYSSALQGTPYTKPDFHDNTVRQFENTTNRQYDQLPEEQKERIDQGVDDFWDSFQATGAEAKVLPRVPTPPTLPHREKIEEAFGQPELYKPSPHTGGAADRAAEGMGADGYAEGARVILDSDSNPPPVAHEPAHTPRREPTTAPPTIAEPPPCNCEDALILTPLRIETANGQPVQGGSIGWHVGGLKIHPPQIECPCLPHCPPSCKAEVSFTPVYRWPPKPGHNRQSGPSTGTLELENLPGPGRIDIVTTITNICGDAACPQTLRQRLELTEANDCCERIRQQNNGSLRFSLGADGHVELRGNQVVVQLNNPSRSETFESDLNMEALFCNLTTDQVLAKLLQETAQASGTAGVIESSLVRDVSMTHNQGGRGTRPHYTFGFQQSHDGREFSFLISMDEATCNVDIQLLYRGRIYEVTGPPSVSLPDLRDQISNNDTGSNAYWDHAINQLFQLLKHEHHGTPDSGWASIAAVKNLLIRQLQGEVSRALNQNPPPHVRDKLNALQQALATGDLGQIGFALGQLGGTQGLK